MNGGEIIARALQKQGVKFLFTLCGGHISPIFVSAKNIGIRVIDTRHEVNAVFAADAVSRLTGVPGVAAVTAGPGLTNTITAVKNAYLAQSPLVLLGGAAATVLKGRGSLQDIDQMTMMRPNVKWATTISKVKEIVPAIEKAFAIAKEGVPGPVFIECPIDILYDEELVRSWYGAKSTAEPSKNLQERLIQWYLNRHAAKLFEGKEKVNFDHSLSRPSYPKHSSGDINKVAAKLSAAAKPIMLVGSGAMMEPEKAGLLAFAVSKLGIPVYLSGMARGLLGKENELQMRHHRKEALRNADLILLAGVPCDFRLDYGRHLNRKAVHISVNRSREDLMKNKSPDIGVLGDPADFLIALGEKVKANCSSWKDELKAKDATREKNIDEQASAEIKGINPIQLFRELDPMLDDKTVLIADGGDFVATSAYTLKPRKPLTWLDPGVFGTLGVGGGFALGAKLVYPDADVFIIYGDGSSAYSLMEFDTFVRHNLPVISIIGNDACWAQIARDQIEFLHSDAAVNLAFSDYELVGKAFGANGERVVNIAAFKAAVIKAKENAHNGKPTVINAIIGKTDFRKGSLSM